MRAGVALVAERVSKRSGRGCGVWETLAEAGPIAGVREPARPGKVGRELDCFCNDAGNVSSGSGTNCGIVERAARLLK